jgi:hypothetical protein
VVLDVEEVRRAQVLVAPLEVMRQAGRELTADWATDDRLPLDDRLAANFARMGDQGFGPSDAWRIHRKARVADQPDLNEIIAGYLEAVISSISLNHLGTSHPRRSYTSR